MGLAVLDLGGAIADANAAFLDIVACEREAAVGRALQDLIAGHARDEVDRRLAKLVLGTARTAQLGQVPLVCGKREREAVLAAARLEQDGELAGLILSAQPAVRPPAIDAALVQAQKLQAVGQLAGGVAHDFNNLLTVILGFTELLLARHGEGDPCHADIVQIRGTASRGVALVRQLLAFSRQQAADPVLVDPAAAIANLSLLLTRLLGRGIELRVEAGDAPTRVLIDPIQFDQVILNLAVNARDAMPEGGRLTIRSSLERLEAPTMLAADVVPPGDYVRIAVKDTGVGIPPEVLGRIFEPFFTTKAPGAGTGLGLATVHGIVRRAGGFVTVDSTPGRGAEFALLLPSAAGRGDGGEGHRSDGSQPAHEPAGAADRPATILLVEDEPGVRALAAKALRRAGYRVLVAEDGEAALALLDAEAGPVGVLVTDVMMPGMDGPALAGLVTERLGDIPVILMSGCADEVVASAGATGNAIVLAKPFTLPELTARVAAALAGRNPG